ncbi:HAD family hydrolase [Demequina mangrovi]|uniref:Haloacid dehalogenase superfamily, subfamily IA, variant 3 with third motif having DD or ED/haloacid dehalogenase superfamily, subfamily IA, variant 1 with third motif having Dx(3-4)D or Dx(3-4)E n=1 Tax=Demequina mangrovi TaxID=1043493 RepID=A0A1H6UUV4_9MICO|nr:HAD-IA family hydrolase [Demequina mangrovi]SEI92110.1 haloacid dehalogenase superfamily, subfamily IA, variant 3 with third motif having DD or ED/haloacid dehalogenase superfamily, subfamily IA, variant 1 with third motif having Dx(3-4)D or Dx(3-4)E [Demequina mangrovi]
MTFSSIETATAPGPDAAPRLPRPRALLLDFGGVVVTTAKRAHGLDEASAHVAAMLERGLVPVPVADIRRSLRSGLTALTHWKHASSRRLEPRELAPREIVGDFLASELPDTARALLVAEAAELLDALQTLIGDHHLRPGVRRLLQVARSRAIPVGIVSNAHSGRSHRRILAELGIVDAFAVQVYSDEVGMRKPNPRMLELAAAATGVAPADCWYVGDTFDRDVVAAHRAGIGAALVTRDKHTDHPPFDVAQQAAAVFDTPEGLADAFEAALAAPAPETPAAPAPAASPARRGALLIDHGGVISASHPDPDALLALGEHLSRLLGTAEAPLSADEAVAMIRAAKSRRAERKGDSLAETQPAEFWVECFGADLDDRARAVLAAEAADLMHRYGRAKSRRSLRAGVADVMRRCRELGMPVVVVSNTLSGRAVRDACAAHGLAPYIGAYVCSDEHGVRKPHRSIVEEALRIADADPASSWFYGDKPHADAEAALAAGIGRRVMVRGGAVADDVLDTAKAAGTATDVVDDATGLLALLRQPTPHPAVS